MEENERSPKPAVPQLEASRFGLAEHQRNVHICTIEHGITRREVINPAFFAHVAPKCRPYDEIIVNCDDGTLYARLLVLQAERTWIMVHVLEWHDLTTKDVALSKTEKLAEAANPAAEFEVKHRGPHLKWCVIRKADSQPVREKEETKKDAQNWLDEYLKVIA